MIEQDTVKLLRECDAGVKMGVSSINEVLEYISAEDLRHRLAECMSSHEQLGDEIKKLLDNYHDCGKDPNPLAKGMSWVKTNAKLAVNESDATIADLMTDGCNMGVKSLNRFLNQYKGADETSKDIAKRLINLEEKLTVDIRSLYYRVVVIRAPLQGLCYTVEDAVDWFCAPTTQMVLERFQPQPFADLLIS